MAQCISPFYKKDSGMSFPCGKCYPCKMRRVHGWSFRLQQELKRSDTAYFVTLTYDNEHVPITPKKFMTVRKRDIQLFFKRLRKITETQSKDILRKKIKYYCASEYGPNTYRPHYHLIIFNAETEFIEQAWKLGNIHYGDVNEASASYTLKYISKDSSIVHFEGDDREKEFSLMSKRLGDNYLTEQMIAWHRARLVGQIPERYHLTVPGGYKIALPRYYKQKIWSQMELQIIGTQFVSFADEEYRKKNNEEKLALFKKDEDLRAYFSNQNRDTRSTVL